MTEARRLDRAAEWIYRGVWAVLVDLLRVPREAPTLPMRAGEVLETFHPAPGFLRYLKLWFWIALVLVDGMIVVAWAAITAANPAIGALLAPLALVLAVVPDVLVYVAIHLRYDTTWYVLTDRSLRLRRGVWIIDEVTITFENVQNVRVSSGPVQSYFGIADVVVETAGSGGGSSHEHASVTNRGLIQGVADAQRIRDLIMARVRRTTSAGLGDEAHPGAPSIARAARRGPAWTPEHVAVLREIRDLVRGRA